MIPIRTFLNCLYETSRVILDDVLGVEITYPFRVMEAFQYGSAVHRMIHVIL